MYEMKMPEMARGDFNAEIVATTAARMESSAQ